MTDCALIPADHHMQYLYPNRVVGDIMTLPNVGVESLSQVFIILKAFGSNPGPYIGYPDWGFRGFAQSLQINNSHLATSVSF